LIDTTNTFPVDRHPQYKHCPTVTRAIASGIIIIEVQHDHIKSMASVWKTRKNHFPLVSSFSPLLGFDHFCSNNQSEEVYFFFFMNICIYLSPILSWIFTFWIASKETKILSYFPHSANTRRRSLHSSLSLPLRCLATKRKEGSLSLSLSLGFWLR
jgi:hypothetical protein